MLMSVCLRVCVVCRTINLYRAVNLHFSRSGGNQSNERSLKEYSESTI